MDASKVRKVTKHVSTSLVTAMTEFAKTTGEPDEELFQGIVNGCMSAMASISMQFDNISVQAAEKLSTDSIRFFANARNEARGMKPPIITTGPTQIVDLTSDDDG